MATLVGYTQQADSLWNHPEWAGTVLATRWVDVDSLAGELVFTLPNFGTQYKAAVLVLSLGDGPSRGLNGASGLGGSGFVGYKEAVHYRLNLGLRRTPFASANPSPFVESSVTDDYPAWSPDGTELVYESADAPYSRILRRPAAGGAASVLISRPNHQRTPDWSPRGDQVAFAENASGSTRYIYAYNLATLQLSQLTSGTVSDLFPTFQPNGQRLAYVRNVPGSGQWSLRRVNLDGSQDAAVLTTPLSIPIVSPRWAPDGQTLYFASNGRLYSVPVSGGTATPQDSVLRSVASFDLPQGSGRIAVENADSLRFICTSTSEPAFMPYRRIALRDTTTSPRDTEMRYFRTGTSFYSPRYSFDNTRIAYRSDQNAVGGGDLYLGQVIYDHSPVFVSAVRDTTVGMGIGLTLSLGANDPDGDALTYAGAYLPAGSSISVSSFSWPSPDTTGGPVFVVFRALSPGGALASKVVKITVVPRPVAVSSLVAGAGRTTAAISWTEPTQPAGQADAYEIRYMVNTAITEQNFASGTLVSHAQVPGPAGTFHCVEIAGLASCSAHHFAIRTRRSGIPSTISNVASASTLCSGSGEILCLDNGLLAGGGGGASVRVGGFQAASTMGLTGATGMVAAASTENSLLGGAKVSLAADLMRVRGDAGPVDGQYRVRLREVGTRESDVDRVNLWAVDRDEAQEAIAGAGEVFVGISAPVIAVWDEQGTMVPSLGDSIAGATVGLRRGAWLRVDLGPEPASSALVVACSAPPVEVAGDSSGIAVQVPLEDGSWQTVEVIHPRREVDRHAVDARGQRNLRLLSLASYSVQSIQRLAVTSRVVPQPLELVRAVHSSVGDVRTALNQDDAALAVLKPGDEVQLAFAATAVPSGKARDLFLFARGAYRRATIDGSSVQASAEPVRPVTFTFSLGAARPNPTTGRVTIGYSLARRTMARMLVYDISGRLVRTLVNGEQEVGPHEVAWDGRSDSGTSPGSGVYFYRLDAGNWRSERKLVVLQK